MSMMDSGPRNSSSDSASSNTDIVTQLQSIVNQLSALVAAFTGRFAFGTLTLGAAATTVVANASVQGNSNIVLVPSNTSAGTLMGSAKSLYVSAISPGVSFTVATANATAAAGTETFTYYILTPQ